LLNADPDTPIDGPIIDGGLVVLDPDAIPRVDSARRAPVAKIFSSMSPSVVRSDLMPMVQAMLDAGPNIWIDRPALVNGGYFQRGLSGRNLYSGDSNGADEALGLLGGRPTSSRKFVSVLSGPNDSGTAMEHMNRDYSMPIAVVGRSPTITATNHYEGGEQSLPKGTILADVLVSMGLFTPNITSMDQYQWASNYLTVVDALSQAGFLFTQGSRGERFTEELRAIWRKRRWPTQDHQLQNLQNQTEILRHLRNLNDQYK
jgi:hypothetical protein